VSAVGDTVVSPMTREQVREALLVKMAIPGLDIEERVHNISACRLPRSRRIMQKMQIENQAK